MREKSRIIVKRLDCNIGTIKDISIIQNKPIVVSTAEVGKEQIEEL